MGIKIVPAQTVFDIHDRSGTPFEVTFAVMADRHILCNLRDLLQICVSRGWNAKRAKLRIENAWKDAYQNTQEAYRKWCLEGPWPIP